MEIGNYNASIGCTVKECKFHTNNDYCSLQHINVVNSSVSNATKTQAITDCASFQPK
ncbi:MAG: DUF1540 domain-containing protein [Vallitalea sp.]|jgi:hypothetical protein|nr:DUF1540 domain-containing protein [Vallitalea sp.]